MIKFPCKCGGNIIEITRDENIEKNSKTLIIRDVPIYCCSKCKKEFKSKLTKKQLNIIKSHYFNSIKQNNFYAEKTTVFFPRNILRMSKEGGVLKLNNQ